MKLLLTIALFAATTISAVEIANAQYDDRAASQDYWSTPHRAPQRVHPTQHSNYPRGYFDSRHGAFAVYSHLSPQEQMSYDENGVESGRARFGTYRGRAVYCWKNRRGTFAYCADYGRR